MLTTTQVGWSSSSNSVVNAPQIAAGASDEIAAGAGAGASDDTIQQMEIDVTIDEDCSTWRGMDEEDGCTLEEKIY